MDNLFLGLDVSTQNSKLVIINSSNQSILWVDSINYDKDLPLFGTTDGVASSNKAGVSESNPLMWIEAVEQLFERANKNNLPLNNIKSISVSGQQHGLVALDRQGKLARPMSKLWNDFSTQEECDLLTEKVGGKDQMIKKISNTQRTGYTASKIYNIYRSEKDIYDKTSIFLLVHNYINWYLTGGVAVMEPGDCSGTALWDPKRHTWSKSIVNSISDDLFKKLPEVRPATQSIGLISKNVSERFGFSSDCTIDAGSGDNMYGAVGTGNVQPGIVTVSLGTSGTAYTFMDKPYIDLEGEIACFCDSTGNYLPLLCVSNMANGYNNFLKTNSMNHKQFDTLIETTKPGNNGNLTIPWFEGERTPDLPNAAPIYFGFNLEDLNKQILGRSILEGHIQNLYDGFKKLPVNTTKIHLTGGMVQSESWCQAIADIFNCETVPMEGEGAALGAALHAAWVWSNENGINTDIGELSRPFIHFIGSMEYKPRKEYRMTYEKQTELYRSISLKIRGFNAENPFDLRTELRSISL